MGLTFEQIVDEALKLSPEERQTLKENLLRSLQDKQQQAIDAAILAECRQRDADIEAGQDDCLPVEEFLKQFASGNGK